MAEEIINRVANSKLVTFDLEELYPEGRRVVFDIKDWLYEGLILREKDFRERAAQYDWMQYQDCFVALTCSTDAIIPGWAYLFLASRLQPYTKKVVVGNLEELETSLYQDALRYFDVSSFEGKPVIIKGCSNKPVPQNAYIFAIEKIPQLWSLIFWIPLAKIVAVRKESFFGPGFFLIPSSSAEGGIELVFLDRLQEGDGLDRVATRVRSLFLFRRSAIDGASSSQSAGEEAPGSIPNRHRDARGDSKPRRLR